MYFLLEKLNNIPPLYKTCSLCVSTVYIFGPVCDYHSSTKRNLTVHLTTHSEKMSTMFNQSDPRDNSNIFLPPDIFSCTVCGNNIPFICPLCYYHSFTRRNIILPRKTNSLIIHPVVYKQKIFKYKQ